jgi:hypothetical protein
MAWDWVTPIAGAAATIVVGVAGIVATYKAGNRQQDVALTVARQQADVQAAVAREERQQRRLEAAYLEFLTVITKVRYWVFTVYPPLTNTPDQYTMPPLPELPNVDQQEALWTAYWSPRVRQLMEEWDKTVRHLQSAGFGITAARETAGSGQPSGIDVHALLLELPSRKQKVIEADERIREQVRLELLGQHDGHAEEVTAEPSPSSR